MKLIMNGLRVMQIIIVSYAVFALIVSTIPFMLKKKISQQVKDEFNIDKYTSDKVGHDYIALIENNQMSFDVRVAIIREAQISIDIAYYSFQDGLTTLAIIDEIEQASKRGVAIRILLDGKMGFASVLAKRALLHLATYPNISLKTYNPINIFKPHQWHSMLHDKMMIVDDMHMLMGGRNLGDRYFEPQQTRQEIVFDRDVLVSKRGTGVSVLEQARSYFNDMWSMQSNKDKTGKVNEKMMPILAQSTLELMKDESLYQKDFKYFNDIQQVANKITLLSNPISLNKKEPTILYRIMELAKHIPGDVIVQSPYATANKCLLEDLKEIADNKQLLYLTNSIGGSPNIPAYSNYYYNRHKFAKIIDIIYEYQGRGSIHGKAMLVGKRLSVVGTFNMDDRSIYINSEAMLVIDSEDFNNELSREIANIQNDSLILGQNGKYIENNNVAENAAPLIKKTMFFIVSIFSRLFQFLI